MDALIRGCDALLGSHSLAPADARARSTSRLPSASWVRRPSCSLAQGSRMTHGLKRVHRVARAKEDQ